MAGRLKLEPGNSFPGFRRGRLKQCVDARSDVWMPEAMRGCPKRCVDARSGMDGMVDLSGRTRPERSLNAAGTAAAARRPAVLVKLGRAARQRSARHAIAERPAGRGLQRMARVGLAGRPAQKTESPRPLKNSLFLCHFSVLLRFQSTFKFRRLWNRQKTTNGRLIL